MTRRLRRAIWTLKLMPVAVLIRRSAARAAIERDVDRWIQMSAGVCCGDHPVEKLRWMLWTENLEEFRNLLYWRIGSPSRPLDRLLLALSKRLFPPLRALFISSGSIGAGFVIKHGYNTVIEAESIGEDCMVFQDVVVGGGTDPDARPTIGNRVYVSAGAKVLGRITLGDCAVVAANAVVTRNLPPGRVAVGAPATMMRRPAVPAPRLDEPSAPRFPIQEA